MLTRPKTLVVLCALLSGSFAMLMISVKQYTLIWFGAGVITCLIAIIVAGRATAQSSPTPTRTRTLIIGSVVLVMAAGIVFGALIGRR